MNLREFFSSAIAFLAALFTRKQTTLGTAPTGSPTTLIVKGWADPLPLGQTHVYVEDGHVFYTWPPQRLAFELPQFHRNAFTLTSPPTTPDELAAIQRFYAEDYARKVQDGRIRS